MVIVIEKQLEVCSYFKETKELRIMMVILLVLLMIIYCRSFKFKKQIIGQTGDNGKSEVRIIVALKHLSNFRIYLEMLLISCKVNFILTWSANRVISLRYMSNTTGNQAITFAIIDTNLYVLIVALPTQHNSKPFQQLKSQFKGVII